MAKIIEEVPLRGGPFGGQMQRVSTIRRLTPQVSNANTKFSPSSRWAGWHEMTRISLTRSLFQVIVAVIKNLINFNKSLFDGFASIVIPSLIGIAALNSKETIRIEASEASWLGRFGTNKECHFHPKATAKKF